MKTQYGGWQIVGSSIGDGGQGKVYKAFTPQRVRERETLRSRIVHLLGNVQQSPLDADELASRIVQLAVDEDARHFGALKLFNIPNDDEIAREEALGRLRNEMEVLGAVDHPNVIKLLAGSHLDAPESFIVMEFHAGGSLAKHLNRYKGQALKALEAFRPLVEGVSEIHSRGAIHRDIKTQNVLLGSDGRLVLADFGIVFLDNTRTRLTRTIGEKVGSSFWMPPWAFRYERLDQITPAFDIFLLGKILWSMISGRDGFPSWDYDHAENNLAVHFPDDPAMPIVNNLILRRCLVRDEKDCIKSATGFLQLVDAAIWSLRSSGEKPDDPAESWPCKICGKGRYRPEERSASIQYLNGNGAIGGYHEIDVYVCDNCNHFEIFRRKKK